MMPLTTLEIDNRKHLTHQYHYSLSQHIVVK